MIRIPLVILVLATVIGCSTRESTQIFVISPTDHDWEAAFSKLKPEEQSEIRNGDIAVDTTAVALDNSVYHFGYGPPSGRAIEYEKLDLRAICAGYDERYAARSTNRWKLVSAVTFSGFGAENELPIYSYSFEMHFQLVRLDRTLVLSGEGTGPTSSSGSSLDAVKATANQAFALAFLKLIVQLSHAESGG